MADDDKGKTKAKGKQTDQNYLHEYAQPMSENFEQQTSRKRVVDSEWRRDPKGPLLPRPPPDGFRPPNGLIWGHSIKDFSWIDRIPNSNYVTLWSRSMIKEFGEDYSDSEYDGKPEPEPRRRRPWPIMRLQKGVGDDVLGDTDDIRFGVVDEGSDHEGPGVCGAKGDVSDEDDDGSDGDWSDVSDDSFSDLKQAFGDALVPNVSKDRNAPTFVWAPHIQDKLFLDAAPSVQESLINSAPFEVKKRWLELAGAGDIAPTSPDDKVQYERALTATPLFKPPEDGQDAIPYHVKQHLFLTASEETRKKILDCSTPEVQDRLKAALAGKPSQDTSAPMDVDEEGAAAADDQTESAPAPMDVDQPKLKCGNCGKEEGDEKFKVCSACHSARYCSADCQRKHWEAHKSYCKAAKGIATMAEGASANASQAKKKRKHNQPTEADDPEGKGKCKASEKQERFDTIPKLQEFVPEKFFPDVLLVHDPDDVTTGKEKRPLGQGEPPLNPAPIPYKRVRPVFEREKIECSLCDQVGHSVAECPVMMRVRYGKEEASDTPEWENQFGSRVAEIHLSAGKRLGSGHHSFVYSGSMKLPEPLTTAKEESPSGMVGVAAKVAYPATEQRRLLEHESKVYDSFPKYMQEEYCGYHIVPPITRPVPSGAVVPKFYGYYAPMEGWDDTWEGVGGSDGEEEEIKRRGRDEKEYRHRRSPIMLVEDVGVPIEPTRLTLDEKTEVGSLLLRLHIEGYQQQSFYIRNICVQPGPLTAYPSKRSLKTPSFRIIDFGRTLYWKWYVEEKRKESHVWKKEGYWGRKPVAQLEPKEKEEMQKENQKFINGIGREWDFQCQKEMRQCQDELGKEHFTF